MEKHILQSEVDGKEVTIEFDLKFLSNQLRAKIYNLDAEFQKKFNAEFKDSKVAKLQKELTAKIKEVEENATNLSLQQKNAIINQLYLKFVTDLGNEDMIDENSKYTISTWNFNDEKMIETLKLIVKKDSLILIQEEKIPPAVGSNPQLKLGDDKGGISQEELSKGACSLVNSAIGSEFWMNCDIEKVGEIVNSFRTRYKIAG